MRECFSLGRTASCGWRSQRRQVQRILRYTRNKAHAAPNRRLVTEGRADRSGDILTAQRDRAVQAFLPLWPEPEARYQKVEPIRKKDKSESQRISDVVSCSKPSKISRKDFGIRKFRKPELRLPERMELPHGQHKFHHSVWKRRWIQPEASGRLVVDHAGRTARARLSRLVGQAQPSAFVARD
jgi:hypothetical protein